MSRHFTADLHFHHLNSKGTGVIDYCQRPFSNIDEMNEGLIENWNSVVKPKDEIWVEGDLSFGKWRDAEAIVKRLNGSKRLVMGNHDKFTVGKYLSIGFDEVYKEATSIRLSDGRNVILNHYPEYPMWYFSQNPQFGPDFGKKNFENKVDWRSIKRADWLLCGHVHEAWRSKWDKYHYRRIINVGVDVWGMKPVSEEQLIIMANNLDLGLPDEYVPPQTLRGKLGDREDSYKRSI